MLCQKLSIQFAPAGKSALRVIAKNLRENLLRPAGGSRKQFHGTLLPFTGGVHHFGSNRAVITFCQGRHLLGDPVPEVRDLGVVRYDGVIVEDDMQVVLREEFLLDVVDW